MKKLVLILLYMSNISIVMLIFLLKKFSLIEYLLKFNLFVVIFSFIIVCIYYKFFPLLSSKKFPIKLITLKNSFLLIT